MRKWIDLFEAKMVDGFMSGPSYSDLQRVAGERDLRGVAFDGKVYLADALEWVHRDMRNALGIPPLRASRDSAPQGFDFYVGTESYQMDVADDRFDWFGLKGSEHFTDGELVLNTTCENPEDALRNAQFKRMVGPMQSPTNLTEAASLNDRGLYKRKRFWSGAFDLRDGEVIEVHRYRRAEQADFHHSYYFSAKAIDAMNEGEAGFFWIDQNGQLQATWRDKAFPEIERRLRDQIDIIDTLAEGVEEKIVYHGGPEPIGEVRVPFFVSPSKEMAKSYADPQNEGVGHLTAFRFAPKKVAEQNDIRDVALTFTDLEDWETSNVYEFVSPNVRSEAEDIIALLVSRGFDCAYFFDLGMHHEFEEFPAYCVFDPSILTPITRRD